MKTGFAVLVAMGMTGSRVMVVIIEVWKKSL
jgi:hypothetical protein